MVSAAESAPCTGGDEPILDEIGSNFGTDKATAGHGYLVFYERFLAPLRHKPVKVLEIGVFGGASLRMWREYFPRGRIVGADISIAAKEHSSERIDIEIADQSDVADLIRIGVKHGPFDVVIDDGSHVWSHQITSLQYLYPFVQPGGFYILEDLHTSFGKEVERFRGESTISAAEYMDRFSRHVLADPTQTGSEESDAFTRTFARLTEFVAYHRHTAVLRRRPVKATSTIPPLLKERTETPTVPAWLLAHIGSVGDSVREGPLLVGTGCGGARAIQGFALGVEGTGESALSYKVAFDNGAWSDWFEAGRFAGTRGCSVPIRGFAIRGGERLRCRYAGMFGDSGKIIEARDGDECFSPDGDELVAMEVVLNRHGP